jgi:hypothetical protein
MRKRDLNMIALTEELATDRYAEVKYGKREGYEFGEMSPNVTNILVPYSGLQYPDATIDLVSDGSYSN